MVCINIFVVVEVVEKGWIILIFGYTSAFAKAMDESKGSNDEYQQ